MVVPTLQLADNQERKSVHNVGPKIGKEDEFERRYTDKFRALVGAHGEFVRYDRDRAALDMGLHLTTTTATERRVSSTRIWFQLKGVHKKSRAAAKLSRAADIPIRVTLDHLKFWFASPEPIYLAVYLEADDRFFVEDVRDLVYRHWGEEFFAPGTFRNRQRGVTVRIRRDAVLTPHRIMEMRRHQGMRIDGPFFRGRPLGHRLDPLRCCLNRLEPSVYVPMILRLLAVHDYRVTETLDRDILFPSSAPTGENIVLTLGKLYNTFEWVPHLFTEFGMNSNDDFRMEGEPQFAHGPVAVCIHGNPQCLPNPQSLRAFAQRMISRKMHQLLVFANTHDTAYFGSFFGGLRETGVRSMPQLLGDLAYSLLTVTSVYLEFREGVSWKYKNYL